MPADKKIVMNVAVDQSVRNRFNAICNRRGLKKCFVMTNIILEYIQREEKADAEGLTASSGAKTASR